MSTERVEIIAELSLQNGDHNPINLVTAGQFYKVTEGVDNYSSGFPWIEVDEIDREIIIKEDGAGVYRVNYNSSFFTLSGLTVLGSIFLNDVKVAQLEDGAIVGMSEEYFANNVIINIGTYISGSVADLTDIDDNDYIWGETNQATGFDVDFDFHGKNPAKINWYGRYDGSDPHRKKIRIWNYNTLAWDNVTVNLDDFPTNAEKYLRVFNIPLPVSDYIDLDGNSRIKIIHVSGGNTNHTFIIDKLSFVKKGSTASVNSNSVMMLVPDDVLDLRFSANVNGVELFLNNYNMILEKIK